MRVSRKTFSGWLSFVILVVLVLLVTVGCTGQEQSTPAEITTEEPIKPPTPTQMHTPEVIETQQTPIHLMVNEEDLAGVVVRFVHPWTGALAETIETIAARFSVTNAWDIWVEVEAPGGEAPLLVSLEEDIAEGSVPGLIAVHPYELATLEGDVFTVNLRHYFDHPAWGLSDDAQGDIPGVFLEQFISESNLIALPVAPKAMVLFYNQTWGEELGFSSPPRDAESFREQSCAAVIANQQDLNEDNDGTGGWIVNLEPEVLANWYAAFEGGLPVDGAPVFNTDAGLAAFSYLKSVYDQGCFWISRQPEPYTYFANRYALMYTGTLDEIPVQRGWMQAWESEDSWIAMGFPGPEGESLLVDSEGVMITADSPENQMAAWLFARYLLEPEVQAELVRSGFTLPVRTSALNLLDDFSATYPQWAQAASLMDLAEPLPASEGWGVGQWLLQDAMYQFIHMEIDPLSALSENLLPILEDLDTTILELEGMMP